MLWWQLRRLRRGNDSQQSDAIAKLSQSKDLRTFDALVRVLQTEHGYARDGAARALGYMQNQAATEPLVVALQTDKSRDVRLSAVRALEYLGGERARRALEEKLRAGDADDRVRQAVVGAVAGRGKEARPAIAAAMQDERVEVRREVVQAFYFLSVKLVGPFADLLAIAAQDSDEEVRRFAGKTLREAVSKGAADAALLPPSLLFAAAVEPSSDIPEGPFDLKHIRERVRALLGQIPSDWWKSAEAKAAVPMLIEKTQYDSYKVRVAAVEALGRIGDGRARKALLDFMFGKVNADRASSMALAGGFAAARDALNAIDPGWRQSEEGRKGVYDLIQKLVHREAGERGHGSYGLPQVDPEWEKSEDAKRALPVLMLGLRYPEKYQRSSAADYLGEIGDPQAVKWLMDAADDRDGDVRRSVRSALAKFMPEAEIEDRLRAHKQASAGEAAPAATPAPAAVAAKRDRSQEFLKKAWDMDPNSPACFECGKRLGGGESLLDDRGGKVFTAGIGTGDMQQNYKLFNGTLCFACIGVFCMDCVGKPVDKCPQCGGATKGALYRELLELRGQAGARRVQSVTATGGAAAAVAPAVEEDDSMVGVYAEEILRFLTTPRTKDYERQTNSWWTKENLQLVLAKAGMMEDAGEMFVPRFEAAIRSLEKKGKLRSNGAGYRAS